MRDISYALIQLFMSSVGGILLCMTFSISWTANSTSAQSTDERKYAVLLYTATTKPFKYSLKGWAKRSLGKIKLNFN